MRVALYWHNGRSLGHTAECAKIAHGLVAGVPDLGLAGITGAYHGLDLLPAALDVVKLPSFANYDRAAGWDLAGRQGFAGPELFSARAELIDVFLRHFAPDVLLVNHLPSGAEDELVPALSRAPTGRRVLTLRGILLDRDKTRRDYFAPDAAAWIARTFDAVHVHTDPAVFRLEDRYDVPAVLRDRIRYTGYLAEPPGLTRDEARARVGAGAGERLVVASMGGGQGAGPIWEAVVAALDAHRDRLDRAVVVTGPYLEPDDAAALAGAAAARPWLDLRAYVADLPAWVVAADLFLGAAGSNMLGEILAAGANAVVVPRQVREPEQRWHAALLADRGLVRVCDLPAVLGGGLGPVLAAALDDPRHPAGAVELGGARRYPALLAEPTGAGRG